MVKLGSEGKSQAQICRDLGIHHTTFMAWTEKHQEFSEAVKNAYFLSMAWWEDLGMDGVNRGMKFNATAYIFQVKNRFPREYRDRQEHQVTGKDGGPIVQEHRMPDLSNIDDPRAALRAFEDFRLGAQGRPN